MIAAFSYPWVAIYAAHFFSRRVVILQGSLISIGFGVGLIAGGIASRRRLLGDRDGHDLVDLRRAWTSLQRACAVRPTQIPLTGLLNRNGFLAAALREHAIALRSGNRLTLAVLDLDGFKQINDLRGHVVGDRVLADLGHSWRESLRTGDILARHGGDEFVLLLPATSPDSAEAVLQRLRVEGLPVTWSVGVAEWLREESLGECIARADAHLYSVKHASRSSEPRLVGA